MKKYNFLILLIFFSVSSICQTNTFPTDGNVGIGTINPSQKLQVIGNAIIGNESASYLHIGNNNYSTSAGSLNPGIYFYKSGTTAYGMKLQYVGGQFGTMMFGPNQASRFLSFGKVGSALEDDNMIEYMRINLDNGNVGIGTSTPQEKLHVEGSLLLDVYSTEGNENGIFFREGFNTSNIYNLAIMVYDHNGDGSTPDGLTLSGYDGISFSTNSNTRNEVMRITQAGNVGIGTTNTFGYKLAVNGTIGAKEVIVETTSSWPDYVFAENYILKSLEEVETFINKNRHLPGIPTEIDVKENGVNLAEMNALLLEKIEELTLYVIELKKENQEIKALINKE